MTELDELQQREIDYWRTSPTESPQSDSVYNLVYKMSDVLRFNEVLQGYLPAHFSTPGLRILELGGGQGWSACLMKRLCPDAFVTLTDISPHAVQSSHKWERVFDVKLDAVETCTSYDTRQPTGSVDVVYCFAAAHHFRAHRRTLTEIHRILRPGGVALYFFEPVCPGYLYRAAYRRINRGRPEIEEDVLVWRELLAVAGECGLRGRVDFFPSTAQRRPVASIYYSVLSRVRSLCRTLPCSANFVFTKLAA